MRRFLVAGCLVLVASSATAQTSNTPAGGFTEDHVRLFGDEHMVTVLRDRAGAIRHLNHTAQPFDAKAAGMANATPRSLADAYVRRIALALSIPSEWVVLDDFEDRGFSDAGTKIQFAEQKVQLNVTVVSYVQTHFGLPLKDAGLAVTVVGEENPRVRSATSSIQTTVDVHRPDQNAAFKLTAPTAAELGVVLGINAVKSINRSRLAVYRYRLAQRVPAAPSLRAVPAQFALPVLLLPPVSDSIQDGHQRLVNEVFFTIADQQIGDVNWRALIDVQTASVLYLRPGISYSGGRVYVADPITLSGDTLLTPTAPLDQLNGLRSPPLPLQGLATNPGVPQGLAFVDNEYVRIAESGPPTVPPPSESSPGEFDYSAETDHFAATNAYYHTDALFRFLAEIGLDVPTFLDGTAFPVPVDHRALGDRVGAIASANRYWDGTDGFLFGRAAAGSTVGIAADWRVALHEFSHVLLLDHVHSMELGFAHSPGDSLAAILNDPGSIAPDRFSTYPWIPLLSDRRHDRGIAEGWGWGGSQDLGSYHSEQIMSTTLFRAYRALGGDDTDVLTRRDAARYSAKVIVLGIGLLSPYAPPAMPEVFESALLDAEQTTITAGGLPGGWAQKVIWWSFAKQGLHRQPGQPPGAEGRRRVDVYVDDGRDGDYLPYQACCSTADIWSRLAPDGGTLHQAPLLNQWNYIYVRVKNRGFEAAENVHVRAYHRIPGAPLIWPQGVQAMRSSSGSESLEVSQPIPPGVPFVVGPFVWYPTVANEVILAEVSTSSDLSNIDGDSMLPVRNGPVPLDRLVPFDNNIAFRSVEAACSGESAEGRGFADGHSNRTRLFAVRRDAKGPALRIDGCRPGRRTVFAACFDRRAGALRRMCRR